MGKGRRRLIRADDAQRGMPSGGLVHRPAQPGTQRQRFVHADHDG
jgi:hypothetical protein